MSVNGDEVILAVTFAVKVIAKKLQKKFQETKPRRTFRENVEIFCNKFISFDKTSNQLFYQQECDNYESVVIFWH